MTVTLEGADIQPGRALTDLPFSVWVHQDQRSGPSHYPGNGFLNVG
jgi:hypothetical protein